MYADLLERDLDNLEPDQSRQPIERLKVIVSESQRLSRLILNVLTFARQQRHTLTVHPAPANVDDVITTCLERFRPALSEKQINIQFNNDADETVNVDVDVLEQILVNLLSNVEKYAADGKWVTITSCQEENSTSITIADDGPGISTEHKNQIFRPFHRVSDTLEDAPGTGIGLSIARELARLHGGDVVLENSERGARFCVTLHKK